MFYTTLLLSVYIMISFSISRFDRSKIFRQVWLINVSNQVLGVVSGLYPQKLLEQIALWFVGYIVLIQPHSICICQQTLFLSWSFYQLVKYYAECVYTLQRSPLNYKFEIKYKLKHLLKACSFCLNGTKDADHIMFCITQSLRWILFCYIFVMATKFGTWL